MTATGHRYALRERELNVTRAGRHVDDQVVEVAPVSLGQELGECLGDHGSTPDHGLFGIDQEADRHGTDPMTHERLQLFAIR